MTTRKQPSEKKPRQPARTPAASSEPTTAGVRASAAPAPVEQAVAIPVARETHASAVEKPGLIPR